MLTKEFQHGASVGRIRQGRGKAFEFDKALITRALIKIYGEVSQTLDRAFSVDQQTGRRDVRPEALSDPTLLAEITFATEIAAFPSLGAHLIELHAHALKWRGEFTDSSAVDALFRHYLEHEDLWGEIGKLCESTDDPNGPALKPGNSLTDAERADPLLSMPGSGQKQTSASD